MFQVKVLQAGNAKLHVLCLSNHRVFLTKLPITSK